MITLPGIAIQNKIYESSNSLVYRGIREDGVEIVVKMLKLDYPSPQELTRYRQEYKIIRSLNLEGVIKAYSQQDYQRTLVILLEDFGGESLEKWMQKRPDIFCPMPLSTFLGIAIALCDILGRIHAANIIHKDINPGNIVFNLDTGVVKIIDFGVATQFNRTNPTFKSPHVLEGTLAYLSPEQTGRMNRMLDYRTDFYSLGVTFYELLTGQLPFPTQDILELVHCHIAKPPIPVHELNATIPKPISGIILKLMAKNAEDRYQSAWGIKADLERCAGQLAEMGQINAMSLGLQDVSEQFCIPQKLYGREVQTKALLAAFDRVARKETFGEICQLESGIENAQFNVELMLVAGYAGVGKTALVQELYKPITAKHGYFISGKFDQFRRNIPYSAIVDALQKLVQQLLGEPDEQVQQWQERLLTALGSNGQIIIDVIPEVELIIGKQPPVPEVGATEAQNRFNRIFQNFVRVFCSKEHPLVIFLDDLQWSDSATLKLIELILLDEQTHYLFLIGAYRDSEVHPTHPLVLTLLELRNQGAVLQEITLAPLTLEPLSQLIAETLGRNIDTVRSLAQLVLRKTEGNPFFVGEFLRMLYSENLLIFNAKQLSWQWDIAQIQARNITDNVVELLLLQLKKLPNETRQILRLAACVGSEFDLETLAIACEKSPKIISLDLLAAINAGLIQPLSELDENLLVQDYKFLHDRVQQAAYALIDESHKQVVHLQIGGNLLEKTSPEQRSDRLFEIIDHLNQGLELVTARSERTEIARLNLMAGQKAKAATAYEAAFKYFTTGLKLLNWESWLSEYDLTLTLYSEAAEAAYLQGCFDEMEQLVEVVLARAKTVVDKVQVYDSSIQRYLSQGNLKEALKIGLEVLKLLGVILPENPSELDVQGGLESTAALLAQREIEDLSNLPEMTAPEPLAAMSILANIGAAAFIVSPALFMLITCKTVNLSINYGNAIWSPLYYAGYGFVLCGVVQDIELGYKFGQLALSLAERLNTKKGKAKALQLFSDHVMQWKVHLKETIPLLVEAYQEGVETGDFETAGYAAYDVCYNSFFVGESLTQLEQKTATYSKAVDRIRRESPSTWIAIVWQTILNLLDRSLNPSRLVGRVCNEEQALPHALAVKDGTAIQMLYLHKVILCYLFEEYHQAVQTAILARQHFEEVTAIKVLPVFCFYHSLTLLSLLLDASNSEKLALLNCVNTNQEKMQKWAEHAPMNYLHKFYLVEAEKARVLGQFLEAEELYEQAIAGAAENEYIQEEALTYELAAKHYLARGRSKIAQTYMKEAHYCYDRWGAIAKVKDLETRYPQFFSQSSRAASTSIPTTAATISNPFHTAFDLAAVMKASQAISREIELKQLLRSLMQTLIENAGAQTGYLILENSEEWSIEAACELNTDENACATQVLQSIPIADQLPESIIQYVIRTLKAVTLNDATREGAFINEPYIQQNQPQSIFCLPLLNQAKLVGVLYLENRLAAGVFTPERSQVLQLLSTQAAIAIENANLYSELRAKESKITQFLEAIPVGIAIVDAEGRPYYTNQCGNQLTGKETDTSIAPEQFSEAYQLYVAGTDQIYPAESLPIVRALRGERIRTEDIEIRRDHVSILIEARGTPVFDRQGNITYAIATFQDITERKQAEKLLADYNCTLEQQVAERTAALRQSEANYRNLIQTANSIILRTDRQGRIRYMNDYGLSFFGYEEDQILGRTLLETIVPETETSGRDLKQFVHDLFHNLEAPLPQAYLQTENENLCRNGRRVWIAWSNQAIFNEQGDVVEILSVGNDTTQRRQAEEALQRSEAKFRNIFENSQVGIFRTRLSDGLLLDANQRYANLLGFDSSEEMIGLEHATDYYLNTSDRQQFLEVLKRDREVRSYEAQGRKRDGTVFWGLFSAYLNADDDYIEGVIADISDLKQTEAALQTSEERLRLALTASNQGLYDFDLKTEERIVNPEYALMLGYDPATFHETIPEWIARLHPDDRESVVATYRACITGEIPNFQVEYRLRTQDGQWKWIRSVGKIVTWNESGEPIRALGVVTDINDRKQAEAALQASEAELRALFSAIPDPLFVFSAEGRFLEIMVLERNLLWQPFEEMIGKTMHQLGREEADEFLGYIQQVLRTQQILTVEYGAFLNGREMWFSARIAPISHDQVIWLVRDITAQKQAEEASILEERNRMAREIHDTLAQAFTGILAQVGAAKQVLTDDVEAAQAHLDLIKELARTGLTEARRSVIALRPQLLEEGSLQSALHRLVAQIRAAATDTTLYYEIEGAVYSLPTEVENNLLRIGQEALTNAIRYANADEIRVELVYDRDQFCLRVRDNGQGFGVGSISASEGFGLLGMSERAERIGAQLTIRSQPGQGTEIIVTVNP
ncbi:serine/threonine protein kinase and signal transduction histidine kinase with GAF and PAS/PAC sensor (plasmid) [Trichormus variabilis ATCC 29413]|uniref:Serine/threonine protein kinase and signal transduction histidine kinase with GAF and PAS/PAC sensor n=2 Tax=Anabaena variabilis TaxID=264691 RepID=Q3M1D8_TRIV2|nr:MULTISPECIES: PAS domain S-box protein [Nostocaceae]ABA25205.1 serine/threonine protein kinase and signal transduction histidine kinase with GAF and PAS/PAC sensor [Trichormus variabilis ATCC 29413]MBC1218174.1 PAS domain S-box protein [Trichormus variabilis ARAD]MBC1259499.1 PAS domain S-box protein [Trichormus variabilis V5]MBC1270956.1 PAS domain S-box protein [Trichormus variabilis FSR]MBC1305893.1 PAS domain S-box protein [Trichormus variabilis N2B]